jgi:transcriptional regulator GlxA family with amidase domain
MTAIEEAVGRREQETNRLDELLIQAMRNEIPLTEIAARSGMSERQLRRRRNDAGLPPERPGPKPKIGDAQ